MEIQIEEMKEVTVHAEVRHCGFCAQSVLRVKYAIGNYQVFCRSCAACGPIQNTWKRAIAMWNRVMHQVSTVHALENLRRRMTDD